MDSSELTDDVNKDFEDPVRERHATHFINTSITSTSTTEDYQLKGKVTPKYNAEQHKNQVAKQRCIVEDDVATISVEEDGSRWRREGCIIQKIVLLENELGRPLTMFDLLCRLDRGEIDSVSDILHWLVVEDDVSY